MTSEEIRTHLEMLLADSKVRHRDIELLYEVTTKQGENIAALTGKMTDLTDQIAGLVKTTKDLAVIAGAHQQRLDDHGERLDGLEGDRK